MFSGWQTFYQLTGSAAAELIGLLFIVATLSKGEQPGAEMGVKLFTTPTVVHLSLVLVVSALALAPGTDNASASLIMTLCALAGFAYALVRAIQIGQREHYAHWSDFWFYGVAPAAVQCLLAATAAAAWRGVPHAAYALGLVLLSLLILAVRNAWDLVTWLAPRRP